MFATATQTHIVPSQKTGGSGFIFASVTCKNEPTPRFIEMIPHAPYIFYLGTTQ